MSGRGESFFYGKPASQGKATGGAGYFPGHDGGYCFGTWSSWELCRAFDAYCLLRSPHNHSGDVVMPILQMYKLRHRALRSLASGLSQKVVIPVCPPSELQGSWSMVARMVPGQTELAPGARGSRLQSLPSRTPLGFQNTSGGGVFSTLPFLCLDHSNRSS